MKQNNNARILPSYPIFVKDPYFSLWSGAEELNSKSLETWFGEKKELYGFFPLQRGYILLFGCSARTYEEGTPDKFERNRVFHRL